MKKTTLLITLIGAFAAGCYSVNTVQNTDTTAQVHPVADRRIVWDETLAGKLDIGTIIESNVGGLRKIEVPLTNRYAYQQDLVYQFVWTDQTGMTVDTGNSWHRVSLQAHETSSISEVAPTPAAHDFVVKFQETKFHQGIF